MHKTISGVALAAALTVSLSAWAHSDEYLATVAAPHGGQLRMAGIYHLELVAKDKEVAVYVTDHGDKEIGTEGGVGKVTLQIGKAKTKTTVELAPAGGNALKGSGDFVVKPGTLIVVFVKLPGQEPQSARFTPLKPAAKAAPAKKTQDNKPATDNHSGHHQHMQH